MVTCCAITGLPCLFELTSWQHICINGVGVYQLQMESIDLIDCMVTWSVGIGKIQTVVCLRPMHGTVKIDSLDALYKRW